MSILKIAGRVYVACACNSLPLKQWRLRKFVYSSVSTVIDPKNSLSQSGVFCEMVETGIDIFNMDFYKWEFFYFYSLSLVFLYKYSKVLHLKSSALKPWRRKGSAVCLLLLMGFPDLLLPEYQISFFKYTVIFAGLLGKTHLQQYKWSRV